MRTRIIILAALGAVFACGAVAPAMADRDGWRRHEWRERGGHGYHHRNHGYGRPYYYGPPVVYARPHVAPYYYAPPPPPVYYALPPAYYAPPSLNFGFSFR